jgi:Fe-S cluster biogenesis protein NfuA
MFIQTEDTPNPNTLKFIPGIVILPSGQTRTYSDKHGATDSKLAQKLLHLSGIDSVFFGHDFISMTKQEDLDWYVLKPSILGTMMEHFVAQLPAIDSEDSVSPSIHAQSQSDDPIVQQIIEILETRVRPAVAQDGGDISFHSFEDGIVYLSMHGACSGCPSSTATLKSGIENMLKYYVPEVKEVQSA